MDCDNCKHKTCWEYAEPCSSCTNMTGVPTNWEPQTNSDRIRAMTDEELAKMINGFESFALACGGAWPTENWLKWLKQEAEPGAKL